MQRSLSLAAALALAGTLVLSGCGPRADRAGGTPVDDRPTVTQQPGPTQPAPASARPDTSSVDDDLASVDGLLGEVDSGLSAVDKTPEDSD